MSTFWQNRRHAAIRALLSSYIDGEVSAAEGRRVEEHLTGCDECAAELESLRATMTLLRRMPMLETPRSYALTPADAEAAAPQRRLPSLASFTGGLATAGATALVVVLIVGVVFLARLGFTGSAAAPAAAPASMAAAPAPAAPAAAPAPQRAMPAAPQPAAAAPAQASAAPAQPAPAAQSAPAAAMTMADEEPSPTVAPAAAEQAVPAAAPAPRAAQEGEEIAEKEVVMEFTAIDDADAEATTTAEAYIAAQATYEADIAEAQMAATAAAQEQVQYATALAQWEKDQEERVREQAEERIATQATYEAQLADSYAVQARKDEARAAGQVESAEIQATDTLEQGEITIPLWVLWIVGAAALVAAIAIAVWLARRRNDANIDK